MAKAIPHFWSQFVFCKHEIKSNQRLSTLIELVKINQQTTMLKFKFLNLILIL